MPSTFIAKFTEINYLDVFLAFAVSLLMGLFIYAIYRMTFAGVMYSRSFGVSLVAMTLITNVAILAVTQSVILSLGMVGALSIIRFRTSIKDSRDTVYIFWTIIIGICCGVGDFAVAATGSAIVFLVLLLFGRVKSENRMLLIIRAERIREDAIRQILFDYFPKPPVLKAQNTTGETVEFIFEINRKMLEAGKTRDLKASIAANTESRSIVQRLYELGGMEYVNIVMQSDEIY